jgi:hypothetical protein
MPPRWMLSVTRRAGFVGLVLVLFVVVQAFASAFYPAEPKDARALLSGFVAGLKTGPC